MHARSDGFSYLKRQAKFQCHLSRKASEANCFLPTNFTFYSTEKNSHNFQLFKFATIAMTHFTGCKVFFAHLSLTKFPYEK